MNSLSRKAKSNREAATLVPRLEVAVAYLLRHAAEQVPGRLLLQFHDAKTGKPKYSYWFDNRALDLSLQISGCLGAHDRERLHAFYGINAFRSDEAKASNVAGCNHVQVDADGVASPPDGFAPSKLIATSKGNGQYVYLLDRTVSGSVAQSISRALTTKVGGDPGGHSAAKLFRVPGTRNFKPAYGPNHPIVEITEETGEIHAVDGLLKLIGGHHDSSSAPVVGIAQQAHNIDRKAIIRRLSPQLDAEARHRLKQPHVYGPMNIHFRDGNVIHIARENCSDAIWRLGLSLKDAGASPPEAFALIQDTAIWRDRVERSKAEDPDRLIARLYPEPVDELTFLNVTDLAGRTRPIREFLLDGFIPMRKPTALYGDGGTGKTLVMLQLAAAIATGRAFLGHEVRHGRVMALLAENDLDDTHITIDDILKAEGVSYDALGGNLMIASRAGLDNVLMSFGKERHGTTPLFQALLDKVTTYNPIAIIIDTAADVFDGEENARQQARRFIGDVCLRLATATGAAVILCAHPSQSGIRDGHGSSGSTGWSNTVRSRLYLRREIDDSGDEPDRNIRVIEVKKANYGAVGEHMRLRWKNGVFILDDNRYRPTLNDIDTRVIDEVRRAFDEGKPWSQHTQAKSRWLGNWIMQTFKKSRKAAAALIAKLVTNSAIVEIEVDAHRHRLGLCTPDQARNGTS